MFITYSSKFVSNTILNVSRKKAKYIKFSLEKLPYSFEHLKDKL